MPYAPTVEESELALARAAAYGLIAYGFHYPEQDTIAMLVDPNRWARWPDVLTVAKRQLRASLEFVRDAVTAEADRSDAHPRELQQRYDELFGHAVRSSCPAYEMEYGRNEIIRQASDLADVAGFYRAFGLDCAGDTNGRPDHIAAECEFMSTLCLKEAHAYAQGGKTNIDICLDAQRAFLRDHLACWLPALAHRILEADGKGFFGALAQFADAFVQAECSHFDVHAGPQTLELRTPDPVLDTQISCGSGGCGDARPAEQLVQLGTDTVGHRNR